MILLLGTTLLLVGPGRLSFKTMGPGAKKFENHRFTQFCEPNPIERLHWQNAHSASAVSFWSLQMQLDQFMQADCHH